MSKVILCRYLVMLRGILIGALWVFGVNKARVWGQTSLEFRHLQEKDGLSYNFIGCFLKDKDGLLWVGTYEGLNYYDGQRFEYFTKNREDKNCIPNNTIYDLSEDKDGDIWYATSKGVGYFNKKKETFTNFLKINGIEIKTAYNIHCDRRGDIWFSASKGLYCYHKNQKQFDYFEYDNGSQNSQRIFYIRRNGIIDDPQKNALWLTTDKGLVYLDLTTKSFTSYVNNPQQLPLFNERFTSAITRFGNQELIFGSNDNELTIFDTKSLTISKTIKLVSRRTPKVDKVSTIFVDSDKNIWVSTWAYTLFYIDGKTGLVQEFSHDLKNPTSVIGNFFWGAFQDANQTVLLGTVNGISYVNPKRDVYKIHSLTQQIPSLLQGDWISGFYEEDNSWLISTFETGLYRYVPSTGKVEKLTKDLSIWDFKKVQHEVFLLSNQGFFCYDLQSKSEKNIQLPSQVSSLSPAVFGADVENDSTLWVVGNTRYIGRYHLKSHSFETFDLFENYPIKNVNTLGTQLLVDKDKDIWVITGFHGFFKFSKSKQQFFPVKHTESVSFETLRTKPTIDAQNNFWLPNKGRGLYRFTPAAGKFLLWSKAEGLGTDLCTSTAIDKYGMIWTCGFNKISVFNTQTESFQSFYVSASEDNNDYISKLFSLKNGHIFASIKGELVELIPEALQGIQLTEKPLVTQVKIGTQHSIFCVGKSEIDLLIGQNSPTILVGYLPNSLHTPYHFDYKLEGFDKNWHLDGSTPFATYSDLPGGDYVFKVRTKYGSYTSAERQLKLHVQTQFYKTLWFRVVVLLLVIGLVVAFMKYRSQQNNKIHHLQIQSTKLEKDKTEIQYQNLINHLNPHFLFNSLTSLNSLIVTEPKTASKFLQKLSAMYRYILQSKDKQTVTLEQELNFVKNYIELQQSRFEEGLQINISLSEEVLGYSIVPVTLQNLFENAIKHNIIDEEEPLSIDVYVEEDFLIVKNNLQRKKFVETSNKQGLESLKKLYEYLSRIPIETIETEHEFIVKIPLL
ncbi:MAG: histidine kinase [Spirosomataceae bacterium]